jgi:hypothetical protein
MKSSERIGRQRFRRTPAISPPHAGQIFGSGSLNLAPQEQTIRERVMQIRPR